MKRYSLLIALGLGLFSSTIVLFGKKVFANELLLLPCLGAFVAIVGFFISIIAISVLQKENKPILLAYIGIFLNCIGFWNMILGLDIFFRLLSRIN